MAKITKKANRGYRRVEYETYSKQGLNIGLCVGLVIGTAISSEYGHTALYMIGCALVGLIIGTIIGSQVKRKNH